MDSIWRPFRAPTNGHSGSIHGYEHEYEHEYEYEYQYQTGTGTGVNLSSPGHAGCLDHLATVYMMMWACVAAVMTLQTRASEQNKNIGLPGLGKAGSYGLKPELLGLFHTIFHMAMGPSP